MGISITVENLDADVLNRLQVEAMRRGVDVSAVIRQLLRDGLCPASLSASTVQTHHDLDSLAGTWSSLDAKEFLAATADLSNIDGDLWK
jgi:plasmid stability protein